MAQILQQYLGQLYLGADRNTLAVGGTGVGLTVGWYYITGYTGESIAQLCEHLQAQIRAIAGGSQAAATVIYSSSTGRITITLQTAATLAFTDSLLATLLGYTSGSYGSATTFVAESQPQYVWRPSRALASFPTDGPTWWGEGSTTMGCRSPTGATYSVEGNTLYDGDYSYRHLPSADVISASATEHVSLQQFWRSVICKGRPMRCYYDRTSAASSNIFTGRVNGGEDGIGPFLRLAQRDKPPYNGYWNVHLPLEKWVSM